MVDDSSGIIRLAFYSSSVVRGANVELVKLAFTAKQGILGSTSVSVDTADKDAEGVYRNRMNEQSLTPAVVVGTVDVVPAVAPQVEHVLVNDGTDARSQVTSLTVVFDTVVDHSSLDDAFVVTNLDSGSVIGGVIAQPVDVDGKTMVYLTFDGSGTQSRQGDGPLGHSLVDGNYQLRVIAASVRKAVGIAMDSDFYFGDSATDQFFRLYGDTDGDRDVDGKDFARIGQSLFTTEGDVRFDAQLDFDGDGDIDGMDFRQFTLRQSKRI